jgi:PEGA domain-containing protein
MSPGWPRFGRTLWPFLFYGSIGFAYFDDDVAFSQAPTDTVGPALGGLQLDVQPRRADVYVDGVYAGPVSDFSGYYHHLDLTVGYHRLIIVTDKYEPLIVDVTVTPGRTETFRGVLSYARD